ncbi:PAS domain S-box protein [Rhizobium daejeonense]|uniref:histidine kinase n=1 Tax=Rhizobium daejeonense TaxID=240521 RepID=A0A6M1S3K5_9HYPH|nr:PAS domain S-box protein [Rhizobium daejeonense]NGO65665.1 PAS domain S-box protein [Rhizobium daejeonense]
MKIELARRTKGAEASAFPERTSGLCRWAGAIFLACGIFLIDTFTTIGSAIAVLYVLVQTLTGESGDRQTIWKTSILCAALTLTSFFYVHGFSAELQTAFRLLFSLAANFVTCALLLRRSNDRQIHEAQARLLELTSDAILLRDRDGRITYWNKGAEDLYGWTSDQACGRSVQELLGCDLQHPRVIAEQRLADTGYWSGEMTARTRDGREITVFSQWRFERDRQGLVRTVMETGTDISQKKQAEAALRNSEHRYRTIFETLAVAIWEHDFRDVKRELDALRARGVTDIRRHIAEHPDLVIRMRGLVRITDVNQTALHLMEVPTKEEFFSHLDDFLPENEASFAHCLIAIAEGHPVFQEETVVRSRTGRLIPIIVVLRFPPNGEGLDRIQASIVDMTERLAFQEALEKSRRELEHAAHAAMIGEISASIAHEVNQPLSAIMAFVQAAQRWLDRPEPDLEEARIALNDAVTSTEQAAAVVKRVRLLLGKAKFDSGDVTIDALISDAIRLKQKDLSGQDIRVSLSLQTDSRTIHGDRILLQQAFVNIIVNAIQAMEETQFGERMLAIETRSDGGDLTVRFTDTGHGLKQTEEALFKAFATTKPDGMGLGLAMCKSIVTAHNGTISISDRDDTRGARVEISLPEAVTQSIRETVEA